MEKKNSQFVIKMKKSYKVFELANIWYNITTTYKLAKKAYLKSNTEITDHTFMNASKNMAILYDYVTDKIEPEDMVKLFDYLAGINRKSGNDIINQLIY